MHTLVLEVFGPLIVAFALFVAVSGARRLLHHLRNRQTPEELQAARDAFLSRLVHPKAEEVETGVGGLLPQRLLTLYEDHQTILTEELEIRPPSAAEKDPSEWIEAFLPLDLESQKFAIHLPGQGWGKGFCFATDGSGNFYWVPVSETRQPDAPVFFGSHDPYVNERVADSLDEFLSWPRTLHASDEESQS